MPRPQIQPRARRYARALLCLVACAAIASCGGDGNPVDSTGGVPANPEWRWDNPVSRGRNLHDMWRSPDGQLFAVGARGTVLHNSGNGWELVGELAATTLYGIWGSSNDDIFTVGLLGDIFHFDGSTWERQTSPVGSPLRAVWGTASDDVFAVGDFGAILHYDGADWGFMNSTLPQRLNAVWGTGPDNVYACGDSGGIVRYNGSAWSNPVKPTTENLNAIWGTSATHMFAVGANRTILHYDGANWGVQLGGAGITLEDVWGLADNDVYAVGNPGVLYHFDGGGWTPSFFTGFLEPFNAVRGSAADDIVAVGSRGTIVHYNGSAFSYDERGFTKPLSGVWARSPDDAYAVGQSGTILRFAGDTWSPLMSGTTNQLNAVWGNSTNVWAVGTSGVILHSDGAGAWVNERINNVDLFGVWGLPTGEVFAVGDNRTILARSTGGTWSAQLSGGNVCFHSIWGTDANNLYAVGRPEPNSPPLNDEPIVHYDGISWQPMATPSNEYWYYDIFGFADSSFVVTGEIPPGAALTAGPAMHGEGMIFHRIGQAWKKGNTNSALDLWGVSGSSRDRMYAAGYGGWLLEYDGAKWSQIDLGTGLWLTDTWAEHPDNVFIVGEGGTIVRYSR